MDEVFGTHRHTFEKISDPTPAQRHAFDLIGTPIPLALNLK